jgi:stage V sporulation protein G
MEISDVQIYLMNEEKLKAYATVIIDGAFLIRDLKVIQGTNGLFVAMPAKKMKDGSYRDIAHPLNQETRQYFEKKVLEAYEVKVSSGEQNSSES